MEDSRCKRVTISVMEEEEVMDHPLVENVVSLSQYPRVTRRQYVINRTEQENAIWNDLLGLRRKISLKKEDRETTVEAALFWLASLFEFIALILSFSKDTIHGGSIMLTTLLEIFFGACGILVTCYKQWKAWTYLMATCKKENEQSSTNRSVHIHGFIITSNLAGCAMMFSGFTLLFLFDRDDYTFLRSTMYFTGLTIFTLMVVDNIIMNKITEGKAIVEEDQFKLLIHELKEELFEVLQGSNSYERVKVLRDYLEKFEAFKLQPKGYIYPI